MRFRTASAIVTWKSVVFFDCLPVTKPLLGFAWIRLLCTAFYCAERKRSDRSSDRSRIFPGTVYPVGPVQQRRGGGGRVAHNFGVQKKMSPLRGGRRDGVQREGRGGVFLHISSSVTLAQPDGGRVALNNRWSSSYFYTSKAREAPNLSHHLTPRSPRDYISEHVLYARCVFATMHQPLLSSSFPSWRIANPARVSRDPPHRLIATTLPRHGFLS